MEARVASAETPPPLSLLRRHLPLLDWLPRAYRAGFLPLDIRARARRTADAYRAAKRRTDAVAAAPNTDAPIAALQFELGRPDNLRFAELAPDTDALPLADGEVVFAPQSLGANRYITVYGGAYLTMDIGRFVDPRGETNTERFKGTPAWGRARVLRSRHPGVGEGDVYYGFWPLAAYCVRGVRDLDARGAPRDGGPGATSTGYLDLPTFTGPREWLKVIRMDAPAEAYAIDTFEYFKIGLTFAAALHDEGYYDAHRLVLTSASSVSARVIAMCVRERRPDFQIVGLTSPRNLAALRATTYFDAVYAYDDLADCPADGRSLYFDALGREETSVRVFEHFRLARWWMYGEGGDRSLFRLLKRNRRGTFYTNLVDSYDYQLRHGTTDGELLAACTRLIERYDLEDAWYGDARLVSTNQEVFDLFRAYLDNTHGGERVVYRSPLLEA